MTRTLYLVGPPGSGKSTLVHRLAERMGAENLAPVEVPIPYLEWFDKHGNDLGIIELGRRRDTFSGTDALSMSIQPKAMAFMRAMDGSPFQPWWVVGEGDRLANRAFLESCPCLTLVDIAVPDEVAWVRMVQRAQEIGSKPQSEPWWRGRATKVRNLVNDPPCTIDRRVTLDGTQPVDDLASQLQQIVETQE